MFANFKCTKLNNYALYWKINKDLLDLEQGFVRQADDNLVNKFQTKPMLNVAKKIGIAGTTNMNLSHYDLQ